MPTLAATNGRPLAGAGSADRRRRPSGSRSAVASDTEHQRKTNWLSARLARAFQTACRMAAQTTRARAGPLTRRSYRTSGADIDENPSIDRGLPINYTLSSMITVPTRRVKQVGVEFYQAGLSAKDIDRLVKFEVLGYSGGPKNEPPKKTRMNRSRVNWDSLEKRIGESEAAYQRPVIRRKIDELVAYYRECKDAATLPAIPGAVIITSEKRFTFTPVSGQHDLGLLQIPEEHGVLRVLDGQHRLLALHALSQAGESMHIEVPAVLFDSLDARQIVELFVTINAKHTRLNPSHIISLAGRKLYPDANQALAHDVIRSLNEDDTSPLHGEIKMLGAARRRDRGLLRDRREGRQRRQAPGAPGRSQAFLPELHQGALDDLPGRLGWTEVLDQDRRRAARIHPDRTRCDGARPRAAPRSVRSERDPRGDQALGRAAARPALRDRRRVEAEARRRHARDRRGPHARAARRPPLGNRRGPRRPPPSLPQDCAGKARARTHDHYFLRV